MVAGRVPFLTTLKAFTGRGVLLAGTILGISMFGAAQNSAGDLQRFVGQKFILHSPVRKVDVKVKMSDLSKLQPGCDYPIEIARVSYSGDRLRFDLQEIGQLLNGRFVNPCPVTAGGPKSLIITSVSSADLAAGIDLVLSRLLMTPEVYIAYRGMKFNSDPGRGLGEQVLRTLPLWRFEPARKEGKPVAFNVVVDIVFRLY